MCGWSRVHTYSIAQHSSPYCAGSMVCFGFLFWKVLTYKVLGCVQTDATLLTNNSQYCWMLHVASVCTPCYMLLDVVACCCVKFETGQTFQPTTPKISFVPWSLKRSTTMLDSFAQLFQHCWGHSRPVRMVYKDLWAVSFPRCTAGPNIVRSGTYYRPRWPFSFLSGYIYASQIESLQLRWCGPAREEMSKDPHYP